MIQHIRPAAVLDVGAHVGELGHEVARTIPDVPVHLFEPSPESFTECRRRLQHFSHAHVHNIALGAHSGHSSFFVNANAQTNSLLDNADGNLQFLPGQTRHLDRIEVRVDTLDNWLAENRITGRLVVKVDVQGAEQLLLSGGASAFTRQVDAALFEVEYTPMYKGSVLFLEFTKRLRDEFGLQLGQLYPAKRLHGLAAWGDVLFVRPQS